MCYGCYEEFGKPTIVNDLTKAAAVAIARVYECRCAGGNLHIVVDDWNLDDEDIAFCIKYIGNGGFEGQDDPEKLIAESECAEMLKRMTLEERVSALAIYDGFLEINPRA